MSCPICGNDEAKPIEHAGLTVGCDCPTCGPDIEVCPTCHGVDGKHENWCE